MTTDVSAESVASGRPFTRDDLAEVPDDGRRYEVVDGTLVVGATPGRLHQRACFRLARLIDDACPPQMEVLLAPFAVALADDTEIQPDIVVGRVEDFTERELPAPPLPAVEVLSPNSRLFDINVKRARFEQAGTPSFWVVDPAADPAAARLVAWELAEDGHYRQVANVVGHAEFVAKLPFEVVVTPADLTYMTPPEHRCADEHPTNGGCCSG